MSRIEWTDMTWNPGIYGCSKVSRACQHCYAMGMAFRLTAMGAYPPGITRKTAHGIEWTGKVIVADEIQGLDKLPKRARKRVFVTSMSDVFHEAVPGHFIERLFLEMEKRPHLTFQVLTKRPERAVEWWRASVWALNGLPWPTNVHIGVTVEHQKAMDERARWLLQLPARVRFLSCEPLVGPVDLTRVSLPEGYPIHPMCGNGDGTFNALLSRAGGRIHWIIAGGESGPCAQPSNPAWFRSLRDQCEAAGVPFFFKQWGEWMPLQNDNYAPTVSMAWDGRLKGLSEAMDTGAGDSLVARYGRKHDPKTLDGVQHHAFPETP